MEILYVAVLILALLALVFGAVLGFAAIRFKVDGDPIVDQIDNLLPQTQCGQCGHPGCKPYAEAIANGDLLFIKNIRHLKNRKITIRSNVSKRSGN